MGMIDTLVFTLLAFQAEAPAAAPAAPAPQQGDMFSGLLFPLLATAAILILMNVFRPREDKKQKTLIDSLEKNDRILLAGGVYARVINVKPDVDEVVVRVDEDRDVKMTVTKSAVLRKVEKSEKDKENKEKTS
jgi:preprotein translocase YajC subunit